MATGSSGDVDAMADAVAGRMGAMRLDDCHQAFETLRIEVPAAEARAPGPEPHMAYWGGPFAAPLPAGFAAPPATADDVHAHAQSGRPQ